MMEEKYLDEEFRQLISDMKPHTKVLPYKSGKTIVILKDAHHSSP